MKSDKHTLYKIYYSIGLVYVGRTNQPLNDRLRGHFKKAPMMRQIEIEAVTLIESVEVPTEADMFVYEIYLINKYKPMLNGNKAKGELTIELPELDFRPYDCKLIEKWKTELTESDSEYWETREHLRMMTEKHYALKQQLRQQVKCGEISYDEMHDRLDAMREVDHELL